MLLSTNPLCVRVSGACAFVRQGCVCMRVGVCVPVHLCVRGACVCMCVCEFICVSGVPVCVCVCASSFVCQGCLCVYVCVGSVSVPSAVEYKPAAGLKLYFPCLELEVRPTWQVTAMIRARWEHVPTVTPSSSNWTIGAEGGGKQQAQA